MTRRWTGPLRLLFVGRPSMSVQKEVQNPAPSSVRTGVAAVAEDPRVLATRLFQGVGQDRQDIKAPIPGDGPGNLEDDLDLSRHRVQVDPPSPELAYLERPVWPR